MAEDTDNLREEHYGPLAVPRRSLAARAYEVARQVVGCTLSDGFVHAGNIAYLSIVTIFPLVTLVIAVTAFFGRTDAGWAVIAGLLQSLPGMAEELLYPIITEVIAARSGALLWIGGLVALWTVSTFVETLRNLLLHAYRVKPSRPFWAYRLLSGGTTLLAVIFLLVAFLVQLVATVALGTILPYLPIDLALPSWINFSQLIPPILIFLALWVIFKLLAPVDFRRSPGWPGAAVTTLVWVGAAQLLGPIIQMFGGVTLTYGALSGVMITLLFFYIVGIALVVGAQLNAALANSETSS